MSDPLQELARRRIANKVPAGRPDVGAMKAAAREAHEARARSTRTAMVLGVVLSVIASAGALVGLAYLVATGADAKTLVGAGAAAVTALVLVPLFARYAWMMRDQPRDLFASGVEARAIVLDATENVWSVQIERGVSTSSFSRTRLALAVQLPGGDPYEVTVDLPHPHGVLIAAGMHLRVYVDRARRERLAVDWQSATPP